MLTILFLGDVVGEPGRKAVIARLPQLKEQHEIDFTIVNGENAAGGRGITGKIALGRFLDGKVSAVIGTHTHVQTADEQIFPGGTAFMCDAGMCGPVNSILGRAIEPIMNRFISNLPASFPVAAGEVRLRGALIKIDESTGRAWRILRVDAAGPRSEEHTSELQSQFHL